MKSTIPSASIWTAIACVGILVACSPEPSSEPTETPEPQTIWPQLQLIEPSPAAVGEEVLVVGSGGYIQFEEQGATGYDESFRTFRLYLNDELIGEIGCFVNRCEGEIVIPADLEAGEHELSVEGGSRLRIDVVEK